MIKLKFLKKVMLIREENQKSLIFTITSIFINKGFMFQPNVCNRCHDLSMSMNLSNIYILNIESDYYRCIIYQISKSEAIKWLQNIDLAEIRWKLQKKGKI